MKPLRLGKKYCIYMNRASWAQAWTTAGLFLEFFKNFFNKDQDQIHIEIWQDIDFLFYLLF